MKASMLKQLSACAILSIGANAHAVVESGHWNVHTVADPQSTALSLVVAIDQTPGGDETGTVFNYDPALGTLQFVTMTVDEGSHLFLTHPGQVLTDQTLLSTPPESFRSGPVTVGQDFYLGGRTYKFTDPEFSWQNPVYTVFGWAHLKADANGQLQVIDSAMAFREGGIIVGTTQAVPEPATVSMMGLGLVSLVALRRRRQPTQA
ncbi:MAG: PEP-CTERM sorting domain-containing protein [Pseudomonadota bacterium]